MREKDSCLCSYLSSFWWSLIIVAALAFQAPPWGSLCGRCEYAGCRAKVPYFPLRPSRAVKSEFAVKRRFRFASEPTLLSDFSPSINFLARHLWENRGAIISLQTGAADKRGGKRHLTSKMKAPIGGISARLQRISDGVRIGRVWKLLGKNPNCLKISSGWAGQIFEEQRNILDLSSKILAFKTQLQPQASISWPFDGL